MTPDSIVARATFWLLKCLLSKACALAGSDVTAIGVSLSAFAMMWHESMQQMAIIMILIILFISINILKG